MRILSTLGLILLGMLVLLWTQQRRLIYFPFGQVPEPQEVGLARTKVVSIPTSDGLSLRGWFVATEEKPWFTVIVFNGNSGNRGHRARLAAAFAERGLATLLLDYRGFGGNPGTPSEEGLAIDARGARDYVLRQVDTDPRRLGYYGESLGSAVAARLAVEHPPAALILRSPFMSLTAVGQVHYPFLPVARLLRDRFPTGDRIGRVSSPLLVIAGDRDRIVPFEQSRQVYESAREPKSLHVVRGADHNDPSLLRGQELIASIVEFLERVSRRPGDV